MDEIRKRAAQRALIVVTATPRPPLTRASTPVPSPNLDTNFYFERGKDLYVTGQYLEAIAQFKLARRAKPQSPGPFWNMGLAYERLGNNVTAPDYYFLALSDAPDNPTWFTSDGGVYSKADPLRPILDYDFNSRSKAWAALGHP